MKTADYWIKQLDLQSHPEGGFFKETYRSSGTILKSELPHFYAGDRVYSTAIYFLLNRKNYSAFHKIHQDEMWHFYDGTSLTIHMIHPDGNHQSEILGKEIVAGESLQIVVAGGSYFAAEVNDESSYTLSGCTVAPGFDFADFEMPDKETLIQEFPQHTDLINRLGKAV
jgi:uncharacterized protein